MIGDTLMGATSLGQKFMGQAKGLYKKLTEDDKELLSQILLDATKLQPVYLTQGEDAYFREMGHLKAQFMNLSAEYANEVQDRVIKMIGDTIGAIAAGFIKRML